MFNRMVTNIFLDLRPMYKIEYDPRAIYGKYEVYRNKPYFFNLFDAWYRVESFQTLKEAEAKISEMQNETFIRYYPAKRRINTNDR